MILIVWSAISRGRRKTAVTLLSFALLASPLLIAVALRMGSGILFRIEKTQARVATGQEGRLVIWRDTWHQIASSPVIGSGLEERRTHTYPHNFLLEGFMATGVLGGSALVLFLLLSMRSGWHLFWMSIDYGWIGILLIQQAWGSMFSGSLYGRPELWYLMSLSIALISYGRVRDGVNRSGSLAGMPGALNRNLQSHGLRGSR
jgi:O-antigen ligase